MDDSGTASRDRITGGVLEPSPFAALDGKTGWKPSLALPISRPPAQAPGTTISGGVTHPPGKGVVNTPAAFTCCAGPSGPLILPSAACPETVKVIVSTAV